MMQGKILSALVLMVAAVAISQWLGCSLLGLGVGAISDASKPNQRLIPGWQVETVKPGTAIDVLLKDGTRLSGKYAGVDQVPADEYARAYAQNLEEKIDKVFLPALGDSVMITALSGKEMKGEFVGFDYAHPLAKLRGTNAPVKIDLDNIKKIVDSNGNVLESEMAKKLIAESKIPFLSSIAVHNELGKTQVGMDKVHQIQVSVKKRGAVKGFLIGAAVDVTVLVIAVASTSSTDNSGGYGSGGFSCPFIYSFDGEHYVLDSETFGGAIFKAAQRTDWDNLDHLREARGTYRLKLTNELQETQYIDELKLLVVDHPKRTKVVPSFSGELHTLSALQMPAQAIDFHGHDVLDLVQAKDERFWLSNPFGRHPENKAEGRDGLILEFARPKNADAVKLAFNVQNTFWASYLQGEILKLHGRELGEWYDLMNSSAVAREALRQAMIREGMLVIKLWNGENWQEAGYVWEVGPSVPKAQVVALNIQPLTSETLRVKLESTTGFWMINSVQADYSPDLPLQITELSPFRAVNQLGKDLQEVLNASDARYYTMPTTQDWAELVFAAPPQRDDDERSFILKSAGYYTFNVSAEGEPQRELLTKLMIEPGAYGQYTLRLLNEYVVSALTRTE